MSDSFAPTALFLDCNNLYHKLRASDEALACGYCGIAATPRLRVGAAQVESLRSGGGDVTSSDVFTKKLLCDKSFCYVETFCLMMCGNAHLLKPDW